MLLRTLIFAFLCLVFLSYKLFDGGYCVTFLCVLCNLLIHLLYSVPTFVPQMQVSYDLTGFLGSFYITLIFLR